MFNKKLFICILAAVLMLLAFASAEGYPESSHPYPNGANQSWTYTHPDEVYALKVVFSAESALEADFDFLYITDESGVTRSFTGSDIGGAEVLLMGSSFTLRLKSDGSENDYGFAIESIVGYSEEEFSEVSQITLQVDSYGCIVGYSGLGFNLVIPETVNDIPVTSIGNNAFQNSAFRTVSLPAGITGIGSNAFSGCSALQEVNIPSGVTSIGANAFYGCASLKEIAVPEGVVMINDLTFSDCTSLESISLPEGLLSIGICAFQKCASLQNVDVPESVASIGSSAFSGCSSLRSVSLPEGLDQICDYLFNDCTSLKQINLPPDITSIGEYAFYGCASLSEISIPGDVSEIGWGAFQNCSSLRSANLQNGIITIRGYAFAYCESLRDIDLPGSIMNIEYGAFCHTGLSSITLPESLSVLESELFEGCSRLIHVSLPENLTTIDSYAFKDCSSLRYIDLPDGVTSIGWSAFLGCSALKEITLPTSVGCINSEVFQGCTSLARVNIPDEVTAIYENAFSGCTALRRLYIPANVSNIHATALERNIMLLVDYDSYAERFAKENGYEYMVVAEGTPALLSISNTPAQSGVGESITWTVEHMGGSDVQFSFDLYRNGNVHESTGWISENSYTHEFTLPGLYQVIVSMKNAGSAAEDGLASGTVHVRNSNPDEMEIYDCTLQSPSETKAGQAVRFSFKLRGGSGNYALFPNVSRNGSDGQNNLCSNLSYDLRDMGSYFLCQGSMIPAEGGVYGLNMLVLDDSGSDLTAEIFSELQVEAPPVRIIRINGLEDDGSYYANTTSAEVQVDLEMEGDTEGLIYSWVLMRDDDSKAILDQFNTDTPELNYMLRYEGYMCMEVRAYDPETNTYSAPCSAIFKVYPMEDYEDTGILWGVWGYGIHEPGDEVNWSVNYYSEGEESYEFSFTLRKEGEIYAESGWIAEDNFSVVLEDLGKYTMECCMRDAEGTVYGPVYDESLPVVENMIDGLEYNGMYMRYANNARNEYIWTCDYWCYDEQPIEYRFDLYKDGEPYWDTEWASSSEYGAEFRYRFQDAGKYVMYITLRDQEGNTSSPIPFDPIVFTGPVIDAVTPSTYNTALNVGDLFSVNCIARYGAGQLNALFKLYKDGELVKTSPAIPLIAKTSYEYPLGTWHLTLAEAGEYYVSAQVVDYAGNWSETVTSRSVIVSGETPAEPVLEYITVSDDFCFTGDSASWTAVAYGGSGSLSYIYSLYRDGKLVETFDPQQDETLTCTFDEKGYYTIKVIVEDEDGSRTEELEGPPVAVGTRILVASIETSASKVFTPGMDFYLHAGTYPVNATFPLIGFSSDNESVARVDDGGFVQITGEGTAVITVTAEDGGNAQAQCEVTSGSGNTIKPPAGIAEIKAEAFLNTAPVIVDLYDCDEIIFHNSAFSGCENLKCVLMPENADFGEYTDIFSENPDLVLFCRTADQIVYADENRIPYVVID